MNVYIYSVIIYYYIHILLFIMYTNIYYITIKCYDYILRNVTVFYIILLLIVYIYFHYKYTISINIKNTEILLNYP